MLRIYVASSWRNDRYCEVVNRLRAEGHDVYDFRNPAPGDVGFSWRQVPGAPEADHRKGWPAADVVRVLAQPRAQAGFKSDMDALEQSDVCVLVLPCGRSAHLELGWAVGAGRRTVVLLDDPAEPDLMHLMADRICLTLDEVVEELALAPAPYVQPKAAPKVLGEALAARHADGTFCTKPSGALDLFGRPDGARSEAGPAGTVVRVQVVEVPS